MSWILLTVIALAHGVSLAAPDAFVVQDFSTEERLVAAPWPDVEGAAPTSKVSIRRERADAEHATALRVDYSFPSERCTQVRLDIALPACGNYSDLSLQLRGDGSGNVLEVWTGEQARGWRGVGHRALDFRGWRTVTLPLADNYTVLAHTVRLVVRRQGELGDHGISLDDITLSGPVDKPLPADFSVGPNVPDEPPFRRERAFEIERRRIGDRTVALVDGDPLMCVLDVVPTAEYLELARQAGVNCFALDLYWRDLEPERGFDRWQKLRRLVDWLGDAGFGVAMLVNIHQPRWLIAQLSDEPLESGAIYPNHPVVRREFERFLNGFLPRFASARNLLIVGVSGGGEADANFPEPPGSLTRWRASTSLLEEFRGFLRAKYGADAAWRDAWQAAEAARLDEAVPPVPLGDGRGPWTDLRRSWHDWREFVDQWWLGVTDWQARIVKQHLPGRLLMVRFGWPVFQCENIFLIRNAPNIDMIQCKDAVPTWEAAGPWFLASRAALYHGAVRNTEKVSFPEVDVGHNRGRPSGSDMTTYLPPLGPFLGALWYYRGLHETFIDGLAEAIGDLKRAALVPTQANIAIFYGQKNANWTQHHANYANEAALAGAARALGESGLAFTVVSEYTLDQLGDVECVILGDTPVLPREAARAIEDFAAKGGRVVVEDLERQHLDGTACELSLPDSAFVVPGGFFGSIQPRGDSLMLDAGKKQQIQRVIDYLSGD